MAILTVSRLYGSGGSEVAAIVAKTLGWSLLDNAVVEGFGSVPGLMQVVNTAGLSPMDDLPVVAAGCELVLESLVARKKIARSDAGTYGRAVEEKRRRPYQD